MKNPSRDGPIKGAGLYAVCFSLLILLGNPPLAQNARNGILFVKF